MKVTTKTRIVLTNKAKRELRIKLDKKQHGKLISTVRYKMGGYGNGSELATQTGLTWHELNDLANKRIAKPSVIKRLKTLFGLNQPA